MADRMDMPPVGPGYPATGVAPAWHWRKTLWSAIVAGALVAMVVELTLFLLGVAVGLTVVGAHTTAETAKGTGIGTGLWWIVSNIISLFLGGWVAGRQCLSGDRSTAAIHGLSAWALATLLWLILMAAAAGTVLSSSLTFFGQGLISVSQVASGAIPEAAKEAHQHLSNPGERDKLPDTGEAKQKMGEAKEEAAQKSQEAAGAAASGGAWTTWAMFIMLFLSGLAALFGGAAGASTAAERAETTSGRPPAEPPPSTSRGPLGDNPPPRQPRP